MGFSGLAPTIVPVAAPTCLVVARSFATALTFLFSPMTSMAPGGGHTRRSHVGHCTLRRTRSAVGWRPHHTGKHGGKAKHGWDLQAAQGTSPCTNTNVRSPAWIRQRPVYMGGGALL